MLNEAGIRGKHVKALLDATPHRPEAFQRALRGAGGKLKDYAPSIAELGRLVDDLDVVDL